MNAFVIDAMRNSVSGRDRTLRVDVLHAGALHVHQPAVLHDAPHHAGDVRVEAVVLHRAIDLGEDVGVLGPRGAGAAGDERQRHGGDTGGANDGGTGDTHGP